MVAGGHLFNSRREVWAYADRVTSPPQAIRNSGFSAAYKDFLRDVLQPSSDDRPSAEGCLMKPWITNKASGSEYSIGSDLYNRLANIERSAPDIDTFSDMAVHQAPETLL